MIIAVLVCSASMAYSRNMVALPEWPWGVRYGMSGKMVSKPHFGAPESKIFDGPLTGKSFAGDIGLE